MNKPRKWGTLFATPTPAGPSPYTLTDGAPLDYAEGVAVYYTEGDELESAEESAIALSRGVRASAYRRFAFVGITRGMVRQFIKRLEGQGYPRWRAVRVALTLAEAEMRRRKFAVEKELFLLAQTMKKPISFEKGEWMKKEAIRRAIAVGKFGDPFEEYRGDGDA